MEVRETREFAAWLRALRDPIGRRQIVSRIARIATMGSFGDFASVGDGVSELRIRVGPGYRVYYTLRGKDVVILLAGGDKGSQERDLQRAKEIAARVG